ncbi:MAG: DNA starvation/stationary phase protection protein [Acidobacteriota bacterium]
MSDSRFKRPVLDEGLGEVSSAMQRSLVDLIDLHLQAKQAHWNLRGNRFRSLHLQLDELFETVRQAVDQVAERITTLGVAVDGRAKEVAEASRLDEFPEGFIHWSSIVPTISDRLSATSRGLRQDIAVVHEFDPISEDLLIGIVAEVEEHLWMFQAQEED